MRILLYQIYGNTRKYHLELTYSVLSAARFLQNDPDGIRIVLAADADNRRPDLPVELMEITPRLLRNWQMGGCYNHAIQAYALHHAVRHFAAPVILIDSDTVITDHPKRMFERIAPGKTLMHAREGRLGESPEWPQWSALVTQSGGVVSGCPVSSESVMYNAGVLGVHPFDAPLMYSVKSAMKYIRDCNGMFTAVQLAASLVFSLRTKLSVCDDIVEHYWGDARSYYHYQIERMFPTVLGGMRSSIPTLDLRPLMRAPVAALHHKLAARIKRLQRASGPEYGSAYTAYLSALSLRDTDPDLANVWAARALGMLQYAMRDQSPRPVDFLRFTPAYIDAQLWMQRDLRRKWLGYWLAMTECMTSSASQ